MKFKKIISCCILFVLLFISNANTFAQCAMCKTSVESDLNNGGSIGKELNTGILYLMTLPYIILMLGAYFFFKKQIDARVRA
ncbi:MAG TPA: hypothetical protein VJI69_09565, partial [Bacteroidia bacterium]|nr:hypothetical protein [Bacteroidia bacterium]